MICALFQVPFRGSERISWVYLLHSRFPKDDVVATVYRAGEKINITIRLAVQAKLVPTQLYDRRPRLIFNVGFFYLDNQFFWKNQRITPLLVHYALCVSWFPDTFFSNTSGSPSQLTFKVNNRNTRTRC